MGTHLILDANNIVVNVIEYDDTLPAHEKTPYDFKAAHPEAVQMVKGMGDIGWKWNGTEAVDPNPASVPAAQSGASRVLE